MFYFQVPLPLRVEPDSLSQSVTVNTRVAIDLVQQMWNSPCTGNFLKYQFKLYFLTYVLIIFR